MDQARSLPSGTVTFLFTDIEGSTRLWEQQPEAMRIALARHDAILRHAIGSHRGHIFKTVGDAFCAVFATAPDALAAALAGQQALCSEPWKETGPVRVRMALHCGASDERGGDYFGPPLNRVARLLAAGHGGQILLSQATADLVREALPGQSSLGDMGAHRLKDLQQPEHLFQLLHPALPTDFPPPRSLEAFAHNLPAQLTSFVGRKKEIADVKRLLGTTRLLTLTGSGGCGKTRLALQVAAEVLEEYPHGVWLVELAALSDPGLVPQTVATALGVREEPGRPLIQTLIDYLRPKSLLLVLDNCEHLLAACARLAESLLRACTALRILASSREGVNIGGEIIYRVPSLSLPDLQRLPAEGPDLVAALAQSEAVCLFRERAVFSKPGFTVTIQNAPVIAQMCHRLDGIPLAIELAAARVKVLPVEQIAQRLNDRFRLLTGGSRTALPRQQTLRALIDWSYDLLTEPERALLRRLSVFVGGWALEAAEAVCSGEGIEEWEVLDLLTALAGKSLVVCEEPEGEGRYRLLETVRQYSRDRLLETSEVPVLRDRHRDWYLSLAERAEVEWQRVGDRAWIDRLDREHDNLRAALEWSVACGEAEEGLRIGGALYEFWWQRGYYSEGRERIAALLGLSGGKRTTARVKALYTARQLAGRLGDQAGVRACYEEGVALARELGDPRSLAWLLGEFGPTREEVEESLAIFRELDDKWGIIRQLLILGGIARRQSDWEAARKYCEEGLATSRELGHKTGIAWALQGLGHTAVSQAEWGVARPLLQESLVIVREVGHESMIQGNLIVHGDVARAQGDWEGARACYEESLSIARQFGSRPRIATALRNLGMVACGEGNWESARGLLEESLTLRRELADRAGIALCLEGLAVVAGGQGQQERGARLMGAAEVLCEASNLPVYPPDRPARDRAVASARGALGEAAFAAAWAEGRAMPLEEAVAAALEGLRRDAPTQ
jgi:predicted ATPase/class 3 adenylate cyclase